MGPAFYVIAILGCGEADDACRQVALVQSRYESIEACNAATPAAVEGNFDIPFPVVVAQCKRGDNLVTGKLTPGQVELPAAGDRPAVRPASAFKPANPARI